MSSKKLAWTHSSARLSRRQCNVLRLFKELHGNIFLSYELEACTAHSCCDQQSSLARDQRRSAPNCGRGGEDKLHIGRALGLNDIAGPFGGPTPKGCFFEHCK